jgi:hypothetical protein
MPPTAFDPSNAVFLDFETYGGGKRGERPVLATVLDTRSFRPSDWASGVRALSASPALRTFVLDPRFVLAAREKRLGLLLPTAFSRWLTRWQASSRTIVGFSMHEHTVLTRFQPDGAFTYENLLPRARAWRWRHHPDAIRRFNDSTASMDPSERRDARRRFNSLVAFLRLAGIPVPRDHGAGSTTSRMRLAEEQLAERGEYRLLTPRAKASWVQVLRHNRFDVVGMALLGRVIALDQRRATSR